MAEIAPHAALPCAALIAAMARVTMRYPFKVWGFGESIAMEALLRAGDEPQAFAAALLDRWARDAAPLSDDPLAHVAPGVPLLIRFAGSRQPQLLTRARNLADLLATLHVGTHGARIHRPDLSGWEHEVWVDCMHLDGPFLAHLAQETGESAYADRAAALLLSHARVLQDERSGLFSHGFNDATGRPNGVYWGRGEGWALLGLVDTARALPDAHPAQREIGQRLGALVAGFARYEQPSGVWHTVVDHPETYHEPSVAAFVALGVGRAVRHHLLDASFAALAGRALGATIAAIDPDGALRGVSDATPVGANTAHYGARGRGVFPWGQGPALLALIEAPPRAEGESTDG